MTPGSHRIDVDALVRSGDALARAGDSEDEAVAAFARAARLLLAAGNRWDECLAAWQAKVGDKWNTPPGRDIVWRSRAKQTPALLAKIVKSTKPEEHPRYMRAFDFLSGPEKDEALKSILGL